MSLKECFSGPENQQCMTSQRHGPKLTEHSYFPLSTLSTALKERPHVQTLVPWVEVSKENLDSSSNKGALLYIFM